MTTRWLRRNRPFARQAQPGFQLLATDPDLARAEFQDLERRLDRVHHLARTPPRRPNLARRPLGAADQAEPHAAGNESAGDVLREPGALLIVVERVKAPAIEPELEWAAGRTLVQKIDDFEPTARVRPGARALAETVLRESSLRIATTFRTVTGC